MPRLRGRSGHAWGGRAARLHPACEDAQGRADEDDPADDGVRAAVFRRDAGVG